MPSKYYQPKGVNREKLKLKVPEIVKKFNEEQWYEGDFEYWYWEYNYGNSYEAEQEISLLSKLLIEPIMILSEEELGPVTIGPKGHSLELSEKDASMLDLTFPLSHPQCDSILEVVKQPLAFPYSCIGVIQLLYKEEPYFSTGTIVGENLILTAAHNCYSILRQDEYFYISFTPSFVGKGYKLKAKNIYIPPEFKDPSNPDRLIFNYCLIEVHSDFNLQAYFGCLPIRFQSQEGSKVANYEQSATLCGFILGEAGFPQLVRQPLNITDNFDVIRYKLNSHWNMAGLGGSPIISKDLEIIGLHCYSSSRSAHSSCGLSTISWILFDFSASIPNKLLAHWQIQDVSQQFDRPSKDVHSLSLCTSRAHSCQILKNDWTSLRSLCLEINIGDEVKLLPSLKLQNLTKLWIDNNDIGDQGCRWLSTANWNLLEISARRNQIKNEGINWLIKAGWKNLRVFNFDGNILEGDYQKWIPRSAWAKLNSLSLTVTEHCQLSLAEWNMQMIAVQGGSAVLQRWNLWLLKPSWKYLATLNLKSSNVSHKGCMWIYQAHLEQLKCLQLRQAKIDDESMVWLGKCLWRQIQDIYLIQNKLTNRSCEILAKTHWPKLQRLNLYRNLITKLGLKKLMKGNFTKQLNDHHCQLYRKARRFIHL